MQLAWLRSTALALMFVAAACGDDEPGDGDVPKQDASVTDAGKTDGGLDAGRDAAADTGVVNPKDASADAGPLPEPADGGLDAGDRAGEDASSADASDDASGADAGRDAATGDAGGDAATGDAGGDAATGDAGSDAATGDAGGLESFASIYSEILTPRCIGCHNDTQNRGELSFASKDIAYAELFDKNAEGADCMTPAIKRVAPGNAAASLLVQKVSLGDAEVCGNAMPRPASAMRLGASDVARIVRWINQGANDN